MRILLYCAILAAVLLFPGKGTDVGKLIPVEVIALSESEAGVTVRTDTGDMGSGRTLDEALQNMKDTAPGMIYLDTAEYLLVETGCEDLMTAMGGYLKKSVRVCRTEEGICLEGIADYLSAHRPGEKLGEVTAGTRIRELREESGRFLLSEK